MSNSKCLTDQQIKNILLAVSVPVDKAVSEHLDSCLHCQQAVEAFNDPEILAQIQTHLSSGSTSSHPSDELTKVLDELIARVDVTGIDSPAKSQREPVDIAPWLLPSKTGLGSLSGFELLRCVGQGGMGVVYLAREPRLQRVVALKILLPSLALNPNARLRFLTEARASAAIKHPNVVTIHDVHDAENDQELPFLVLEYVDGSSLDEVLPDLTLPEKITVARQIALAMDAAHKQKIVHRDIKPSNVLIEAETRTAKLTDFGLAKIESPAKLTQTGIVMGTPGFIAPEVLTGQRRPDFQSDVYSLGVTYRQMFPQVKENPPWLESVIDSMTQHLPENRTLTVAEIVRAFETQSLPATKRSLQNRAVISLALAGVVVAFTIATVKLYDRVSNSSMAGKAQSSAPQTVSVANAEEFLQAIDTAPSGSTLVVQSSETFDIPEMSLKQTSLTIESANGFRPVLNFRPNFASDFNPMFRFTGELKLVGLTVQFFDGDDDPQSLRTLFQMNSGNFQASQCKFSIGPNGTIINAENFERVELLDCEMYTLDGVAINARPQTTSEMNFERCVFTGESVVDLLLQNQATLRAHRCTIFADYFIGVATEAWTATSTPRLTLDISQNIFSTHVSVLGLDRKNVSAEQFKNVVVWKSLHNVFGDSTVSLYEGEDEIFPTWAEFGKHWSELVSESDSQQILQPFAISNNDLEKRVETQFEKLTKEEFQSSESLRHHFAPYKIGAVDRSDQ